MRYILLVLFTLGYASLPYYDSAICYGPFRDGQRPGGESPTRLQLEEDLNIISKHWTVIRLYGSTGVTEDILKIIKNNNLNLKVFLGAWIANEIDPIAINSNKNEINKVIELANNYSNIVRSVVIGNETQVFWSSNKVDIKILIKYIQQVKNSIEQPITTADDFNFWNKPEAKALKNSIDYIMVHIHPLWGGLQLNDAINWVSKIYSEIKDIYPENEIIIGETGWATMVHNEGEQSKLIKGKTGEKEQSIFYKNINDWSKKNNVSTFFFEVFDENWKGGEHPNEVEKHWGVYNSNRTPKHIFK